MKSFILVRSADKSFNRKLFGELKGELKWNLSSRTLPTKRIYFEEGFSSQLSYTSVQTWSLKYKTRINHIFLSIFTDVDDWKYWLPMTLLKSVQMILFKNWLDHFPKYPIFYQGIDRDFKVDLNGPFRAFKVGLKSDAFIRGTVIF